MKVFGTGMQRTGTTSLARALTALGIKTRDCPTELLDDIDDDLIREYDGFTDNPIPTLYRELDRRHPGSKFVHTVRDEQSWLRSVEWLFTTGAEKFNWHRYEVFDAYHREIYGTAEFDKEIFLERYRRHNRDVADYFKGRPDDLLVLNILQGEGFEKLCPFLGIEIPAQPFPHWNKKEALWRVRFRKAVRRLLRQRGS